MINKLVLTPEERLKIASDAEGDCEVCSEAISLATVKKHHKLLDSIAMENVINGEWVIIIKKKDWQEIKKALKEANDG